MISLGIDIGGIGCKCVAFNHLGEQLAVAYREYPLCPGQMSISPEILRDEVFSVIKQCVGQLANPKEILTISVSSFGESFVAFDTAKRPVDDIILYYADKPCEAFKTLVSRVGQERFMQICRVFPDASYSLSKMLYTMQRHNRKVGKFLFVASYICHCLCGASVCDVSLACRSLLYDVNHQCWSDEILKEASISEDQLPEVVPTGTIVGKLFPEIAHVLHLNSDVNVLIGAHDQIVNALGAGLRSAGEAVDTCGTCECITPLFCQLPEDLQFPRNNYASVPYLGKHGYVTYAYNLSAGSVVRWFRDVLGGAFSKEVAWEGESIYDVLNRFCPRLPSNLMFLPFLQGMGGTPDVRPDATGSILGLTTSTRLPDIYRAILEGITYEICYNKEFLTKSGIKFDKLFACGGGARSAVWLQIKADILGCDIIPVLTEETGAMGSAILGIAAISGEEPTEIASRFVRYGNTIKPDISNQSVYQKKYSLYKQLRSSLC